MNIVFLGSPSFAIPTLELLVKEQKHTISWVGTKPDKPAGRGLQLIATPIKTKALELGLEVRETIPTAAELAGIDALVVVAYGRLLPKYIVDTWPCINLHPSLLPAYRGPSPMQSALLNGDTNTGITTMLLTEAMDAGDILLQEILPLDANITIQELHDHCAQAGAHLINKTLAQNLNTLRKAQDATIATYCKKIESADSQILPTDTPWNIHNKTRAIGSFLMHNNKRVKLIKTQWHNNNLVIEKVQPEGKPIMSYNDYINGYGALPL